MAKFSKYPNKAGYSSTRPSGPPVSEVPPSSQLPGRQSGGGVYLVVMLLFAAAIMVLVYAKCREESQRPVVANTTTQPETTEPQLPIFAPPPPPEIEEDAGSDAAAEDAGPNKPVKGPGKGPARAGPCDACGKGEPSPGLGGAVRSTAGTAQGCYNRALRSGGAEGKITVSVSIGSGGNVCGASITSDTINNPAISQCVLGKFRSRSYPKPKQGCVVVNVPISFQMKSL